MSLDRSTKHSDVGLNLAIARSNFCGSAGKFCGWLAGSSRKMRSYFEAWLLCHC